MHAFDYLDLFKLKAALIKIILIANESFASRGKIYNINKQIYKAKRKHGRLIAARSYQSSVINCTATPLVQLMWSYVEKICTEKSKKKKINKTVFI